MKGKKILITGGCGFVGGAIARHLSTCNEVVIVDDLRYKKMMPERIHGMLIPPSCTFYEKELWSSQTDNVDVVIHAATVNIIDSMTNPKGCMDTNWTQTVHLFDKIKEGTQILYLSTSSVYGNATVYPTPETDRVNPTSYYSLSKYMAEKYLMQNHPSALIFRLSNVYGVGQMPHNPYAGVMSKLLRAKITKSPFVLYGDGHSSRDYTYVDDVVRAVEMALDKGLRGVYNVGTGISTTVNDLTWLTGVDVTCVEGRSIDNINRRMIDSKLLTMDCGWKHTVEVAQGIEKQEKWMIDNEILSK